MDDEFDREMEEIRARQDAEVKAARKVGYWLVGIILLAGLAWWPIASYFEARAFNSAMGKNVSTWDAMFIELRVQESAK